VCVCTCEGCTFECCLAVVCAQHTHNTLHTHALLCIPTMPAEGHTHTYRKHKNSGGSKTNTTVASKIRHGPFKRETCLFRWRKTDRRTPANMQSAGLETMRYSIFSLQPPLFLSLPALLTCLADSDCIRVSFISSKTKSETTLKTRHSTWTHDARTVSINTDTSRTF